MTPSMSLQLQNDLREDIIDYAKSLTMGLNPKKNVYGIVTEYILKSTNELRSMGFKTILAKKYSTQLVNAYTQRVMSEIN